MTPPTESPPTGTTPGSGKALTIGAFLIAGGLFLWAFGLLPPPAAGPAVETRIMMDTLVTLKVWPGSRLPNPLGAAFQAMEQVDRLASFHRPDSELSLLNLRGRHQPGPWFAELLRQADEAVRRTGGYFDPTFSVLQRAYGFYDQRGRIPSAAELQDCLSRVGWARLVSLAPDPARAGGLLVSLASGTQIDLGGIAGGFAIERAADVLREAGCPAFFIDDGGDLWMEGTKPDGQPWRVAVRDPRDGGTLAYIESVQPVAISTSGDYERFLMVGTRRINHIFDPRTGEPADHFRSVTVVASSPLLADIWSTALFAMSPAEARAVADRENLPTLFLPATGPVWMSAAGPAWFDRVRP